MVAQWDHVLEWDGSSSQMVYRCQDQYHHQCTRSACQFRNGAIAPRFIWLGEDGSERIVTYGQLHRMVCRFANGLKSLGVVKGRPRGDLHAFNH